MPRSGAVGNPSPYNIFGEYVGLKFWSGGLTLLTAAPGVGKTSWLLRIVSEAAKAKIPAAIGYYEHTPEELRYRQQLQAQAYAGGAHNKSLDVLAEKYLAQCSESVLLALSDQEDTVRAIEETLLLEYGFPERGPAVVAVDYLQRVPVVGLTGMLPEAQRAGEAAAALRALARRRGWAVIAAAALRADDFSGEPDLGSLLGDERVPYEADRVLLVKRAGSVWVCGCVDLDVHTLKDRVGPAQAWRLAFYGARFYPTLDDTGHRRPKVATA